MRSILSFGKTTLEVNRLEGKYKAYSERTNELEKIRAYYAWD